tara:strand:+ start:295 stop:1665 length:1371 start_codon:yes stop_codon:yes gene_type:complete
MKTKSNFIKKWAKAGGNQRGENFQLKPVDKRIHTVKDIPNLQADQVKVIAIVGGHNGQRKTLSTVAELEQQEQPYIWLQQQIEKFEANRTAPASKRAAAPIDAFSLPLSNLIRRFKTDHVSKLRSARDYEYALGLWDAEIGHLPVDQVKATHIEKFKNDLLNRAPSVGTSGNKKLTNKSVRNYLSILSSAFNFGQKLGVELVRPGNNPVKLIDWPEIKGEHDNKRTEVLLRGSDELTSLVEQLNLSESRDLKDFVLFCLITGVRQSEAYGLTWENVDLEHGYVHLNQALRRNVVEGVDEDGNFIYAKNENGGKRVITKGLKNNSDKRVIHLDQFPSVKKLLVSRKAAAAERQIAGGEAEDRVFPQDIKKAWNKVLKRAGLRKDGAGNKTDDLVFHTLRHSAATWQVQDGIPLFQVSHFLGHKNLQSVSRYAHFDPSQAEAGARTAEAGVTAAFGAI